MIDFPQIQFIKQNCHIKHLGYFLNFKRAIFSNSSLIPVTSFYSSIHYIPVSIKTVSRFTQKVIISNLLSSVFYSSITVSSLPSLFIAFTASGIKVEERREGRELEAKSGEEKCLPRKARLDTSLLRSLTYASCSIFHAGETLKSG